LSELHLDDNTASEFVSGALSPARLTVVERHLAACRDCRVHVAALAGDDPDSQAKTRPHDKPNAQESSQVSARPTRTFTVGDRVGRYLVLSTLGTGGMGVVFAAYDPQLDRKVALKLLRAGLGVTTKEARTRLRREAQAIAQLSHPNVVGVYDVGATDDGDLYIAMEFVEGDTLSSWLKRWPRTWREIVDVFLQAARGLYAAHSVGLLHRDFKPDNVLVGSDGRVRVTDFGLARSVMAPDEARPKPEMAALSVELTVTGTVLGTPRYMPPEQLSSPQIDARSDQFSFCVALYEALYDKHPLTGATAVAMLEKGDKASPPPEGTKVPVAIGRAVLRGLEADRTKRFPTVAALMGELSPRPPRSPVRFAALAIAAVIVLGGATAAIVARPQPRSIAPVDNTSAQALLEELNKVNSERNHLLTQFKEAQRKTGDEIERLKVQLVEKDHQIQVLVDEVAKIQQPAKAAAKVSKPTPSQAFQVINAVFNSQSDVDGCFDEWAERITSYAATGTGKKPPTEANLIVHFLVATTGEGQSASATGVDDEAVLQPCVALAMERIKYPPGPEQLDVEVAVSWSEGQVILSPRVVGHHPPVKGTLNDL